MIETVDLTKIFKIKRKEIKALDSVSINVEKGKIGALVGHNGAGKTTLLKILSTLVLPTSGDAFINGYSVTREEKKVRENIGLVTVSERAFYYRLTALDNLIFFSSLQGLSLGDARKRANQLLDFVGLSEWKNVPYMKFSTGMQKKLALARALITDPPVLLMDEPTLGLDLVSAREFRATIRKLKEKNKTILLSSHYLREIEELADIIFLIKRGKIVASGTLDELKRMTGKVLEVITHEINNEIRKFVIYSTDKEYILRIPETEIDKVTVHYKEVEEKDPTLDDIYIHFVGEVEEDIGRGRSGPWRLRE
ncbi:ABC transporter ATP-binding protein [Acidianus ambivalens]|uniref:ATP-binding cassette domain-containing protein n=1 Tax=Acidianus ambivalens TaxID=2283 RepID=A0A650CVF7_ACIAM|nr:ABC transporter ATP-binding protein [Acidianus ambivalens]MQL55573.1 ATP-binding cassette domain-containing protein [Acidianus ambivalens]QGR21840.1 ATP-binding cassette domain-containing protein [Acidianus ambivalens]